ncbi:MAG TPA: hypothetical protein VLT33_11715, partial [Labilithrix sp.]|nr:hypothetical protein [Labilithrix sp.]
KPRELELDDAASAILDLDLAPPSSRHGENRVSSLPPVLDPRSATSPRRSEPSVPPPVLAVAEPRAPESTATPQQVGPPAPVRTGGDAASPPRVWTPSTRASLALSIVGPALVVFFAVRQVPFVTAPLGHAMRGDSPLASGVLAVVALVGAAGLATRALGSARSAGMVIATIGAVLLGIVMIIVTFAASETAELEVPPAAAGIVPFVAPIVPLALGLLALARARALWLSRYERREGVMFAVIASVMLFGALELGPFGAVRGLASAPAPAALAPPRGPHAP